MNHPKSIAPDPVERVLGGAALAMLAVVVTAIARGAAQWHAVPIVVWVHLVTMIVALALTPALLWRRRGDPPHRVLGWIWFGAMMLTALDSLAIRVTRPGHFSVIHILSVFVLVMVPLALRAAQRHDHARHRRIVRGLVIGALLIAGIFTFPGGRLLGHWLLG